MTDKRRDGSMNNKTLAIKQVFLLRGAIAIQAIDGRFGIEVAFAATSGP